MGMQNIRPTAWNPWLHRAAWGVACATFPLIWIGGLVTSYDAGMAVPDWPSTYGYNLFLYPWATWISGPWDLFIEHGHRLWGAVTGCFAISLVVIALVSESRRWVRWLAVICLLLVIFQGLLGGMRVRLDSRSFAQIHGIMAQLFFAFTCSLLAVTSRWWYDAEAIVESPREGMPGVRTSHVDVLLGWCFASGCALQLLLGSNVRHVDALATGDTFLWSAIAHAGMGMFILVGSLLLTYRFAILSVYQLGAGWVSVMIAALVLGQVGLGIATWLLRYGWPSGFLGSSPLPGWTVSAESAVQSWIATAHVATGALILGTSMSLALRLQRACYAIQDSKQKHDPEPTSWHSARVTA